MGSAERAALIRSLEQPRLEVLPLPGVEERVLAHVSKTIKVTVTASPKLGLDATLRVTERLAGRGVTVVPHLSARLVRDEAHLQELLDRLLAAEVREVFVPAGDAQRPGRFPSAAELLTAMGDRRASFAQIGITGYPESHHLISDEATIEAMFDKASRRRTSSARSASTRRRSEPGSPGYGHAAPACRSGSACPAASTRRDSCASR